MKPASLVAAALGVILVGCATSDLPRGARLVGGGLAIDYEARTDGTVILIERTSGKVVATESLDDGRSFTFNPTRTADAAALAGLFPSKATSEYQSGPSIPTNAVFQLYFVPAKPRNE